MKPISSVELLHVRLAILVAVLLQISVSSSLQLGPRFLIAGLELLLLIIIGITAPRRHVSSSRIHVPVAATLIALISLANAAQLYLVMGQLLSGSNTDGRSLLLSALAIFITNIIMFSLWYWELGSPGLSGRYNEGKSPDFLFPQATTGQPRNWHPSYADYLYTSITNSTAFSPTDTLPLTHAAKAIMSVQALISLFTVVIVTARAVNILS